MFIAGEGKYEIVYDSLKPVEKEKKDSEKDSKEGKVKISDKSRGFSLKWLGAAAIFLFAFKLAPRQFKFLKGIKLIFQK